MDVEILFRNGVAIQSAELNTRSLSIFVAGIPRIWRANVEMFGNIASFVLNHDSFCSV